MKSRFLMEGCSVRYRLPANAGALHEVHDDMTTLGSVFSLRGFGKHNGAIVDCDFREDLSLPPGTMVVEPKSQT